MRANTFNESAKAIADRLGVSVKALRVYERAGLIKPRRTASGWRIYGAAEIERLGAIIALKQLGMPLKRIGEVLKGRGDLAAALALQEAALEEARGETERALMLVRAARRKLANAGALSADELSTLVRSTAMTEMKWSPKMDALAQKHYTPEQLQELRARPFTAQDQERVGAAWSQVFSDIDALGAEPDPEGEPALDIARRAKALIEEFTRGDPALFQAAAKMNTEALADPELRPNMPMGGRHFAFISKAMAALKQKEAAGG